MKNAIFLLVLVLCISQSNTLVGQLSPKGYSIPGFWVIIDSTQYAFSGEETSKDTYHSYPRDGVILELTKGHDHGGTYVFYESIMNESSGVELGDEIERGLFKWRKSSAVSSNDRSRSFWFGAELPVFFKTWGYTAHGTVVYYHKLQTFAYMLQISCDEFLIISALENATGLPNENGLNLVKHRRKDGVTIDISTCPFTDGVGFIKLHGETFRLVFHTN